MSSPAPIPEVSTGSAPRLDALVGVPAGPGADGLVAGILDEARRHLPGRPVSAAPLPQPVGGGPGNRLAASGSLPGLVDRAREAGASACAWLGGPGDGSDRMRLLLEPVLDQGLDFVSASYRRGSFDGALTTALVYPLMRALYGVRVRQPLGPELALSRRFAEHLAADPDWVEDPTRAGADLWVVARAVEGGFGLGQAFLGPYPPYLAEPDASPSELLAQVGDVLFRGMERTAAIWQRVRGSRPVPTFGDGAPLPVDRPPPNEALVAAFELGCQDLVDVWGAALPPASLLALRRAARQPGASFRLDDRLWARVVYDFALGHRQRVMDRGQLLRSLTPIYLGWLAGLLGECGGQGPEEVEARVERLCLAFEAEKPYLIARWRWPDRFNP